MTGGTRAIKELSLRDYKFYSKLIPLCFAVSLPYLPPPRASSRPDHERSSPPSFVTPLVVGVASLVSSLLGARAALLLFDREPVN